MSRIDGQSNPSYLGANGNSLHSSVGAIASALWDNPKDKDAIKKLSELSSEEQSTVFKRIASENSIDSTTKLRQVKQAILNVRSELNDHSSWSVSSPEYSKYTNLKDNAELCFVSLDAPLLQQVNGQMTGVYESVKDMCKGTLDMLEVPLQGIINIAATAASPFLSDETNQANKKAMQSVYEEKTKPIGQGFLEMGRVAGGLIEFAGKTAAGQSTQETINKLKKIPLVQNVLVTEEKARVNNDAKSQGAVAATVAFGVTQVGNGLPKMNLPEMGPAALTTTGHLMPVPLAMEGAVAGTGMAGALPYGAAPFLGKISRVESPAGDLGGKATESSVKKTMNGDEGWGNGDSPYDNIKFKSPEVQEKPGTLKTDKVVKERSYYELFEEDASISAPEPQKMPISENKKTVQEPVVDSNAKSPVNEKVSKPVESQVESAIPQQVESAEIASSKISNESKKFQIGSKDVLPEVEAKPHADTADLDDIAPAAAVKPEEKKWSMTPKVVAGVAAAGVAYPIVKWAIPKITGDMTVEKWMRENGKSIPKGATSCAVVNEDKDGNIERLASYSWKTSIDGKNSFLKMALTDFAGKTIIFYKDGVEMKPETNKGAK